MRVTLSASPERTRRAAAKGARRRAAARAGLQLSFPRHGGWGGLRRGAGRKPKGKRAGVSHTTREALSERFPVHVTLRMMPHVWNLRSRRSFRVLRRALSAGGARFGLRVCEFSVQGNHVHLVAEAANERSLSRGMQGLSIRIARGLNRLMAKRGRVLGDRYHARILRSPREALNVLRYVRENHDRHRERWGQPRIGEPDPFSSAHPRHGVTLPDALTFLLRRARDEIASWRRR
jgi:REP element-mobilizing transposase RayT